VEKKLLALDQGFPQPIVAVLAEYITEATLVPFAEIDERLATVDDWEVLLALHHDERAWDGLVTTDDGMLSLPRELSVLMQTRLTLVVAEGVGHDPLKATGLVLSHLPGICKRTTPAKGQIWNLRTVDRPHLEPWDQLGRLADREAQETKALYDEHKLTPDELARNPLDDR
jgi:hypothetical protein